MDDEIHIARREDIGLTLRVIIVRHGQSTYNIKKIIQGRCDESVLTEQGISDAQKTGAMLSEIQFDAFYHSPLQRAAQTAETINSSLKFPVTKQASPLLMEVDLPLWEGLSKDEVEAKFPSDYRNWKQSPHEFFMEIVTEQGTKKHFPVLALYQQAQEFWQEVISQHPQGTILIVAHNGINRCLISSAIGIPAAKYHAIQQSNCGINVVNFTGGWGDPVQLESLNQTAHLGIPLPSTRNPHHGPRFLLVRHGETEWNRTSRFQGQIDIPLNENGKNQARKAAEFLKDVALDFAISSPLSRPKETAEIILEHHPEVFLELQNDLQEISHGLWEGKLESEIKAEYGDLLQQWKDAPETVQMPEGENLQQVWDRAVACWQDIVKVQSESSTPQTGVVVAHDAVNKALVCYLLGLKPDNFWNIKQGNGAVTVIDYPQGSDGTAVLQAVNITSHFGKGILDRTAAGAL